MKMTWLILTFLLSINSLQADCWSGLFARCERTCPPPGSRTDWEGWETNGCDYCDQKSLTSVNLDYTFGRGIDTDKNFVTAELFMLPTYRFENIVPFFTLAAHFLENNKWAGSIGAGVRWRPASTCCLVGFNIFTDFLDGKYDLYNQFGAGLEYLSKTWEARFNAYLPVDRKVSLKTQAFYDDYDGGYFIRCRRIEQPLLGFDFEVGRNLYYCGWLRFYVGMGPAWFEKVYSGDSNWAFKARAYLQVCRYLTFEVRTYVETKETWKCQGNNSGHDWNCQGVVALNIPFDCIYDFYACGFSDLLSQRVYRNDMIKNSKGFCWETNY